MNADSLLSATPTTVTRPPKYCCQKCKGVLFGMGPCGCSLAKRHCAESTGLLEPAPLEILAVRSWSRKGGSLSNESCAFNEPGRPTGARRTAVASRHKRPIGCATIHELISGVLPPTRTQQDPWTFLNRASVAVIHARAGSILLAKASQDSQENYTAVCLRSLRRHHTT
jgi:hypothetical protein